MTDSIDVKEMSDNQLLELNEEISKDPRIMEFYKMAQTILMIHRKNIDWNAPANTFGLDRGNKIFEGLDDEITFNDLFEILETMKEVSEK